MCLNISILLFYPSISLIFFAKDGKYPILVHILADYQILNIFLVAGNVNDSKLVLIYSILKGFCWI